MDLENFRNNDTTEEKLFQCIIEFRVFCPLCGPKCIKIKKNGFDLDHKDQPQLFYCKSCEISFYAHTSWVPHQISKLIFTLIAKELTKDKIRVKQLAKKFQMSPSVLSHIINHLSESIAFQLEKARLEIEKVSKDFLEGKKKDKSIWIDETFFRLKDQSWCLILAVDSEGKPLGWKWGITRKLEDFLFVIDQIEKIFPEWEVMVGDGFTGYPKIFKTLRREGYLIQQIHSHPWKDTHLQKFYIDPITDDLVHITITVDFDVFSKKDKQQAYGMKRNYPKNNPKKPLGRPKGSKNKKKSIEKNKIKNKTKNKPQGIKGPKKAKTHGIGFKIDPNKALEGWNVEILDKKPKDAKVKSPEIAEIVEILDLTYSIMKGKCILSNRIEIANRFLKEIIPDRGLKTPEQVIKRIELLFITQGSINPFETPSNPEYCPISPSIGFRNFGFLIHPSISQIQINVESIA